jgi:hypothetical protein
MSRRSVRVCATLGVIGLAGMACGGGPSAAGDDDGGVAGRTSGQPPQDGGSIRVPIDDSGELASDAGAIDEASDNVSGDGAVVSARDAEGAGLACSDACAPPSSGVTFGCEKRFLYGVNYAWKTWVADFGGIAAWGDKGVSENQAAIASDLQAMHAKGVDVVRWWMLQQLEGDAVQFDSNGSPMSAGGTLVADIQAALTLAVQNDVHYNFTLFSFDDFAPDSTMNGAVLHGLAPIVADSAKLAALMNIVKTVAQTVQASPNADRVVSWDAINEPEWAISDTDPYGDPAFSPNASYEAVTFAQMESFVAATVKTLHDNSSAPVTVGGAAIKWPKAWSRVGLDYYTFHMYDWVNQYYPYNHSLASYGVTDEPVVLGEFPLAGLAAVNGSPAVPLGTLLGTLFSEGYAGAMPWAFNDTCCGSFSTAGGDLETFANAHACITQF